MPAQKSGRAVDVALPYRLGRLTYSYEGPLIPGARVLVPLKGKTKVGLLLGEAPEPPSAYLKEVLALVDEAPIVPSRLLDFLLWTADFHLAPEGEVIKYALPASLFRLPRKKKIRPFKELVCEQAPKAFAITLLWEEGFIKRIEKICQLVARTIESGKRALLMVPDRELLSLYLDELKDLSPVSYSADLTPKRREEIWFDLLCGKIRLIVGTRLALFLPFPSLELLVLDEEEHHGYKQEEGFRGQFRDLALMRAKMEGARLYLASSSPSVKSYYFAEKGKYRLEKGKELIAPLILEDLSGVKGLLSQRLLNRLRRVLAEGGQALLFLNRLGYAPALVCEDCGFVWECPRCHLPLRWFKKEETLRCRLCTYGIKAKPVCPSCGLGSPKPLGTGSERLAEILKNFFPEAEIRSYGDGAWQEADFIISTARIPRWPSFPRLSLVAVVLADQLFTPPSYLTTERAYQQLKKLSFLAREKGADFLVQTYRPEHHVFKGLRWGYKYFLREELSFRYREKYPPFGRLAELILKTKSNLVEEVEVLVEKFLREEGLDYVGPLIESPRGKASLIYLLKAPRADFIREPLASLKGMLKDSFGQSVRFVVDMSPE